jgi:hypothetical protein
MRYIGIDINGWHYLDMREHIKVNVEEILEDDGADSYRPDGFRILARMIARKCMKDISEYHTSTSEEILISDRATENEGD